MRSSTEKCRTWVFEKAQIRVPFRRDYLNNGGLRNRDRAKATGLKLRDQVLIRQVATVPILFYDEIRSMQLAIIHLFVTRGSHHGGINRLGAPSSYLCF
ncbi:hypothetical protein HPP92_016878 [Vanilla planifolia]|uniref:Uncharacterized protein n=1 Tax=Vanilla planifolia TaxID=51239 RepID=A0A835QR60_VANPL|nr:hypothetical protein HPP92_016878 [Vanilla planifolia]